MHVYTECDGDCTGRAYRLIALEPGRYELAPADVAAFLAESQKTPRAATRFVDGRMHGITTTAGMTAALRYIDEGQGRRGTVTALYAKGPKPASSVPPPPPRERGRVTRGKEVEAQASFATDAALVAARALAAGERGLPLGAGVLRQPARSAPPVGDRDTGQGHRRLPASAPRTGPPGRAAGAAQQRFRLGLGPDHRLFRRQMRLAAALGLDRHGLRNGRCGGNAELLRIAAQSVVADIPGYSRIGTTRAAIRDRARRRSRWGVSKWISGWTGHGRASSCWGW